MKKPAMTARSALALAALAFVLLPSPGKTLFAGDKDLDEAVADHDASRISACMVRLAQDDPAAAVRHIPKAFAQVEQQPWKSFYDVDRYQVFRAAIAALSRIDKAPHIAKLSAAFGTSREWQARLLILHVALRQPKMDARALALEGLQDQAPLVVALAARTLGNTQEVLMLTPLLNAMKRWESRSSLEKVAQGRKTVEAESGGRAWLACRDALHKLTGRSFHRYADYRNYITAHREEIDPKKVVNDYIESLKATTKP